GASRHQVVRKLYSDIDRRRLVAGRRRLAVAHVRCHSFDDLGEADHGDRVVVLDLAAVDLAEKTGDLVEAPELRIVVLDVARGEVADPLHLDVVDHSGEQLLPRAVLVADRDPDDLAALVLPRLVAKPDRRSLPPALQLVDERGGEEVEGEETARHGETGPLGGAFTSASLTGFLSESRYSEKPSLPISGTNRHGPITSRSRPSPVVTSTVSPRRRNTVSMSARRLAMGTTRRPPTASCPMRVGGGPGAVAWTAIASTGARSETPALPSPTTTSTLAMPRSSSVARARSASSGTRSTVMTASASAAITAAE